MADPRPTSPPDPESATSIVGQLADFSHSLFAFTGFRGWIMIALSVLAGLAEGIGLLVLIPLLTTVLGKSLTGGPSAASRWAMELMTFFGLPLQLYAVLGFFALAWSLRAVLPFAHELLGERLRHGFTIHLREQLFRNLANADWQYLVRTRASDQIHRLMQASLHVGEAAIAEFNVIARVILLCLHLAVVYLISPRAMVVGSGAIFLTLLVTSPGLRRANAIGFGLRTAQESLFASATGFFAMLRSTKILGQIREQLATFEKHNRALESRLLAFARGYYGTRAAFQVATALLLAGVLVFSVKVLDTSGIEVLALVAILSRVAPTAVSLVQELQRLSHNLPGYDALRSEIDRAGAHQEHFGDPVACPPPMRKIALQGVDYTHPGRDCADGLMGVDLALPVHCVTALTGPSGSGKTTLADILSGLLVPRSGQILLDDRRLEPGEIPAWRKMVGYVPQDCALLDTTIYENLTWGIRAPTAVELETVLQVSRAAAIVARLPEGLATRVGHGGALISGGERQRIFLARELLRSPTLLILDEATAALDEENERCIHAALREMQCRTTVLVIAHRASTIAMADQVYVLEGGRVRRLRGTL